jgi:hypothetical protein
VCSSPHPSRQPIFFSRRQTRTGLLAAFFDFRRLRRRWNPPETHAL